MSISERLTTRPMPHIRYRDVEGSARWLCYALGFEVHSAVRDPDGVMDYVHLTHGHVNVVIKPLENPQDAAPDAPDEIQSHYVYVEDVAGHCATATTEGAEIVIALRDIPGLGRGYSCRDPEGLIWSFGSFDAWHLANQPPEPDAEPQPVAVVGNDPPVPEAPSAAPKPVQAEAPPSVALPSLSAAPLPEPHVRQRSPRTTSRSLLLALLIGGVVGSVTVGTALHLGHNFGTSAEQQLAAERAQRAHSEAATRRAQQALDSERNAKLQFERAARMIEAELATTTSQKAEVDTRLLQTQADLSTQQAKVRATEAAAAALQDKLGETEKQWRVVQASLTEQLDQARAATVQAQTRHDELEATLKNRFSTLQASLRQKEDALRQAQADRATMASELAEARSERSRSESALQTALAELKLERQARADAQVRAEALRKQLAARRAPARKVVTPVKAQPRPRPAAVAKAAVAKRKMKVVVKEVTLFGDTVGDVGFQP